MRGALEEKKPNKMVRSSIACARCRRSKVKCVNNGPNSTCKSCAQSNRECTYPVAGSTPAIKRPEPPSGATQASETPDSKKRIRKIEDPGRKVSQRVKEDVLDSPVLTRKVWDEIFELFKLHFSTEMPFLHPPTFRNRMRQAAMPRDPTIVPADLEEGRVLLLGVLTLTARFHSGLVSHLSPNGSDPLAASEFFAAPLANALGPTSRQLSRPSIENIQALLMLGLYEWSQTRGLSAWLNVGTAIRLAFAMGLAYTDDPGTQLSSDSRTPLPTICPRDRAMEKEVQRRTLWSCFIMDRMLSAGRNRPMIISTEKLAVQLPCSDDQFLFVHNGPTSFLSPKWMMPNEQYLSPQDEGVLSCYLRLVEIFGDLSEWVHAGGRRADILPPWDETTKFFSLRQRFQGFYDNLPQSLTFTEANLSAHIEKRNATTYASLHTLYCLSLIVLHREYMPLVPLRCEKPNGPLSSLTYSLESYDPPEGFWEICAKEVMKSTRDIIEIVRTCQDSNALPESPQIGFAAWQASLICMYTLWFPKMDTEGYLVDQTYSEPARVIKSKNLLHLTQKMLRDMSPSLHMMKGYLKCLDKIHRFFFSVFRDYSVRFKRSNSNHGLEIYKHYERELKELGTAKEMEQSLSETSDEHNRSRDSTGEIGPTCTTGGDALHGFESASQRQNGSWAPINVSSPPQQQHPPPPVDEERPKYPPRGQFTYAGPYSQKQGLSTSVISNGDLNLNATGINPLSFSTQLQPSAPYPSSVGQNMVPPTTTPLSTASDNEDQDFSRWIKNLENISMNTGLDNFAQDVSLEQLMRVPSANCVSHPLNFFQITWLSIGI